MQQFRVGEALSQSFSVFFANLVPFVIIVAVVSIPEVIFGAIGVFGGFASDPALAGVYSIVQTLISLVVSSVVGGALAYGVLQEISGKHVSIGDCFTVGLQKMLPVIGLGILIGLGIFFGLIACIIPGLILATMWYVAVPAAVVENLGVMDGLKRSQQLTEGTRWPVFGFLVIMAVIIIGVSMVTVLPLSLIEGTDISSGETGPLAWVGGTIVGFFVSALTGTSTSVVYFHLRKAKEAWGVEDLATVFD